MLLFTVINPLDTKTYFVDWHMELTVVSFQQKHKIVIVSMSLFFIELPYDCIYISQL